MTDLTEQLYAGTLPTGHYYFNNGVETYIVLYKNINSKHLILQEPEGLTVISEVPSYEEWQQLQNWADFTNDYHELREKLEIAEYENAQLKEQINHLLKTQARQFVDNQKLQVKAKKAKDVVNIDTARQIKQLKELLKDCREYVKKDYGDYLTYTQSAIHQEISQALGEE